MKDMIMKISKLKITINIDVPRFKFIGDIE